MDHAVISMAWQAHAVLHVHVETGFVADRACMNVQPLKSGVEGVLSCLIIPGQRSIFKEIEVHQIVSGSKSGIKFIGLQLIWPVSMIFLCIPNCVFTCIYVKCATLHICVVRSCTSVAICAVCPKLSMFKAGIILDCVAPHHTVTEACKDSQW